MTNHIYTKLLFLFSMMTLTTTVLAFSQTPSTIDARPTHQDMDEEINLDDYAQDYPYEYRDGEYLEGDNLNQRETIITEDGYLAVPDTEDEFQRSSNQELDYEENPDLYSE